MDLFNMENKELIQLIIIKLEMEIKFLKKVLDYHKEKIYSFKILIIYK